MTGLPSSSCLRFFHLLQPLDHLARAESHVLAGQALSGSSISAQDCLDQDGVHRYEVIEAIAIGGKNVEMNRVDDLGMHNRKPAMLGEPDDCPMQSDISFGDVAPVFRIDG